MKTLLIIFLFLFPGRQCNDQVRSVQHINYIEYTTSTRGAFFSCKINSSQILIQSQGSETFEKTREISFEEWKDISKGVNTLNPEAIGSYKSSTKSSALDRSKIANLMISLDHVLFESEAFDEGNPPDELKPLIDKIIALAETVD